MNELTGRSLFNLLIGARGWIHRRVVTVDFAEAGQVRQEVIMDFTLPSRAVHADGGGQVTAPLALMAKGVRIGFDVSGPGGQPVPILTTSQRNRPVVAMLEYAFHRAWPDERLNEAMRTAISSLVVAASAAESNIQLRRVLGWLPVPPQNAGHRWEQETFEALLRALTGNYLLLGVLPAEVIGQRTVVRYSFLGYPPPRPRQWRTPYVEYGMSVADPGFSESLHLEVRVPDELEVVMLRPAGAVSASGHGRQEPGVRLAHLQFLGNRSRFGEASAIVIVQPAAGPMKSFSLAMLLIVTLIAGLAILEMAVPGHLVVSRPELPSPGASVLLGLPALILSWMARRPENVLMRQGLAGVRWVNILGAAALYVMACLAAVPVVKPVWMVAWILVTLMVTLQWLQWSMRVRTRRSAAASPVAGNKPHWPAVERDN